MQSVLSLYKDEALWNKYREIGEKTIEFNYSDEIYFRKILGAIANAEYRRVISSQNNLKKEAWQRYVDWFSKERRNQIKTKQNKRRR